MPATSRRVGISESPTLVRGLDARSNQMVTSEEWDGLERAVLAATVPPPDEHEETFCIEDGFLVRNVVPKRGEPYEHRCELESYETVAHAIDELQGEPFVLEELHAATDLPFTQVAVALACLKERGCVVPAHGRLHVAATKAVHLDAMTEWHALRETGPAT